VPPLDGERRPVERGPLDADPLGRRTGVDAFDGQPGCALDRLGQVQV
jgi:hypothetical protein